MGWLDFSDEVDVVDVVDNRSKVKVESEKLWDRLRRCCSYDPRRTLGLNTFESLRDGV